MMFQFKRAIQDILSHRFLSAVTMLTIALSILIVSAFYLFFLNAGDVINAWKRGIRIMAYLEPEFTPDMQDDMNRRIRNMYGVQEVRFVSKYTALENLKAQMKRQSSLLEDLRENPLPDAFEIRMIPSTQSVEKIETLAAKLESLEMVESVEYGEKWLGRFSGVFEMFRFVGYAFGGVFFMAAVFIVANTIRLVLYARRDEVEIMRLVGATEGFIRAPFYIEGLIQGALGGILGLAGLFVTFLVASANVEQGLTGGLFQLRFLSAGALGLILLASTLVGWLGSFLSMRQFLKS